MKATQFTAIAVALFGLCATNVQAQTATTTTTPKGDASYGMQPASSATTGATTADRKAARAKRTADAKASGVTRTEASLGMQPASSATSGATKAERKAARAKRNAEAKANAKSDTTKSTVN